VKFGSFKHRKRTPQGSLAEGIKNTLGQIFRRG